MSLLVSSIIFLISWMLPGKKRIMFDHITCNKLVSVDEVTAPRALALDLIEHVMYTGNYPVENYSLA